VAADNREGRDSVAEVPKAQEVSGRKVLALPGESGVRCGFIATPQSEHRLAATLRPGGGSVGGSTMLWREAVGDDGEAVGRGWCAFAKGGGAIR